MRDDSQRNNSNRNSSKNITNTALHLSPRLQCGRLAATDRFVASWLLLRDGLDGFRANFLLDIPAYGGNVAPECFPFPGKRGFRLREGLIHTKNVRHKKIFRLTEDSG